MKGEIASSLKIYPASLTWSLSNLSLPPATGPHQVGPEPKGPAYSVRFSQVLNSMKARTYIYLESPPPSHFQPGTLHMYYQTVTQLQA